MRDDPAHIPSTWTRVCGIEITLGKFSAVWAAYSRTTDVVRLYDEYQAPFGALPVHAEAVKARGRWIPALIDPDADGSAGRVARIALAHRLAGLGVNLTDVPLDSEVGLADINDRASTGRLKVETPLQAWYSEYRQYRRDEEGKLPSGYGLMRATGLVLGGLSVAVSENTATSDRDGYDDGDRTRNPSTGY